MTTIKTTEVLDPHPHPHPRTRPPTTNETTPKPMPMNINVVIVESHQHVLEHIHAVLRRNKKLLGQPWQLIHFDGHPDLACPTTVPASGTCCDLFHSFLSFSLRFHASFILNSSYTFSLFPIIIISFSMFYTTASGSSSS